LCQALGHQLKGKKERAIAPVFSASGASLRIKMGLIVLEKRIGKKPVANYWTVSFEAIVSVNNLQPNISIQRI